MSLPLKYFTHLYSRNTPFKEPVHSEVTVNLSSDAERILGMCGTMLSDSKRTPPGRENHTIYWNACVFLDEGTQIWFGDLDLIENANKLKELAKVAGRKILVTPEQPFRFKGLEKTMKDSHDAERVVVFE